ncbi:hypothetical protein MHSWG343_05740 [Candidatus Mycoplasma haematohominis]|uniref:Uncharacterized protein n=1 Tax=Candidatus Mycoplasma haematohominis TaxID=1494318 RepID=A0A478FR12_9MOLU|nr:hypothetical protein MHSWG343_05740 [Candidatus Mycoplasma haemohominis]
MNPLQGAAAIGAGSALIGGGYFGYAYLSISYITIADSSNQDGYKNGVAKDDLGKFVHPLLEENEKWWSKVYVVLENDKKTKQDTISSQFNKVTSSFQKTGTSDTHLNQVCETAIKATEIVNSKYLKNVWTYCSVRPDLAKDKGNEPTVVTTLEGKTGIEDYKLGKEGDNKGKLASPEQVNEKWWNWVYENKFKPRKEKTSSDLSTEFNLVNEGYSSSSNTALNKVCEERYKEGKDKFSDESSDSEQNKYKLKKNVESFCTVEGKGNLTMPTT